jgi:hypothetical protein
VSTRVPCYYRAVVWADSLIGVVVNGVIHSEEKTIQLIPLDLLLDNRARVKQDWPAHIEVVGLHVVLGPHERQASRAPRAKAAMVLV